MQLNRRLAAVLLTSAVFAFCSQRGLNAQTNVTGFTIMDTETHGNVKVTGVSGDGNVVVGSAETSNGVIAFRWTLKGGFLDLLTPAGTTRSIANAVSGDGSRIVGTLAGNQAIYWTGFSDTNPRGNYTLIPRLVFTNDPNPSNAATAISADGEIVVGYCSHPIPTGNFGRYATGFAWTPNSGNPPLALTETTELDANNMLHFHFDSPFGVANINGQAYIAGNGHYTAPVAPLFNKAYLWRLPPNQTPELLAPTYYNRDANAISADGSVIVGKISQADSPSIAYVWHTNMLSQNDQPLDDPANFIPGIDSNAEAVSQDGAYIVGQYHNDTVTPNTRGAFISYSQTPPLRDLRAELHDKYNVTVPPGFNLDDATGIAQTIVHLGTQTATQLVIVGNGHSDGIYSNMGWITRATLPPTPDVTITGTVQLEGVGDLSAISLSAPLGMFHIQLRTPDNLVALYDDYVNLTVTAGSPYGVYTLKGMPAGNYSVWVKGSKNLAILVSGAASATGGTPANASLLGGDTDNSNTVDATDFSTFVGAYNSDSAIPGSGYDVTADYNFDGFVDATDFGILVSNLNKVGAL